MKQTKQTKHKRKDVQGMTAQSSTAGAKEKVLVCASVASMIDQFNMPNLRLLQDMGYEVHVMCSFKEGNTCSGKRLSEFQKELQDMGIVQHQWDCPRSLKPAAACRALGQIMRLMDVHTFSWIHCHSPVGGALARLAAHRAGIPAVYTAHGFHFYKGAPLKNWLLYYPAEWLLARWTDVLITVNREDFRLARRRMKAGKICRIPGAGIDTEKFRKASLCRMAETRGGAEADAARRAFGRKYRMPKNALVLLSAGELNEGKNHKAVIRALAELHRKDVYYLICGQGALKDSLQAYARACGAGGQVRLPGFREDMAQIYAQADIFLLPSRREGMPVALMEAMAAGLPCIVSDIRGNRELICGPGGGAPCRGGARFSLFRPKQLQHALEALLLEEDRRRACGEYNCRKIKDYDIKNVMRRTQAVYRRVQAEAGRRTHAGGFGSDGDLQ